MGERWKQNGDCLWFSYAWVSMWNTRFQIRAGSPLRFEIRIIHEQYIGNIKLGSGYPVLTQSWSQRRISNHGTLGKCSVMWYDPLLETNAVRLYMRINVRIKPAYVCATFQAHVADHTNLYANWTERRSHWFSHLLDSHSCVPWSYKYMTFQKDYRRMLTADCVVTASYVFGVRIGIAEDLVA